MIGLIKKMEPIIISSFTCVNSLGVGVADVAHKLIHQKSGLQYCKFPGAELNTYVGEVTGLDEQTINGPLKKFDCRNNRLAKIGMESDGFVEKVAQAREKYGPDRIAIFIGTSTSGLHEAEKAYIRTNPESESLPEDFYYRETFSIYSVAEFVRLFLGLSGPSATISTSCSSSGKIFCAASRMLQAGVCDAVVVGGVDSLCLSTLYGFSSLGLLSSDPCKPFDVNRSGLSLGEGAGFALLERIDQGAHESALTLCGYGESDDGFHMTSPHPEGKGAILAIGQALQRAGLDPEEIDCINLHGTGTLDNDEVEGEVVRKIFGNSVPSSSTKGWTGHALGAAGILDAVILLTCMQNDLIPCNLNTDCLDPKSQIDIPLENREKPLRRVLSNSFGFGGSNCSLAFGSLEG